MNFFRKNTRHIKVLTMDDITKALVAANLLPEDSCFDNVDTPSCYCESEPCDCLPDSLSFSWYTTDPNKCDTCNATGDESCKTSGGKRTTFHKARKNL